MLVVNVKEKVSIAPEKWKYFSELANETRVPTQCNISDHSYYMCVYMCYMSV